MADADIDQVFSDPQTYSAAFAQTPLAPLTPKAQQILLAGGHRPQPSMVSLDEPAHGRLRRPAARAFSVKRVNAMIPAIEATTARLLDAVAGQPEFDLVAKLAFPLPANIVFSLMGVPGTDFAQLKQWCGYRLALSFGRPAAADQVGLATNIAAAFLSCGWSKGSIWPSTPISLSADHEPCGSAPADGRHCQSANGAASSPGGSARNHISGVGPRSRHTLNQLQSAVPG